MVIVITRAEVYNLTQQPKDDETYIQHQLVYTLVDNQYQWCIQYYHAADDTWRSEVTEAMGMLIIQDGKILLNTLERVYTWL